jgi:fibrillarin-like rRNA methylase
VSRSADLFLGIIAVATLLIALIQVGVIVAAGLVARRVARLADQVEREIRPILDQVTAISRDASRATALAAGQVERVDQLFADLARRVDATVAAVQEGLVGSAREGRAIVMAFKAAFNAIRDLRETRARQRRGEDEDALFI